MKMLKLCFKGAAALCLSLMLISSAAQGAESKYVEGTHYKLRAEQASPNKEIREFFSFWCGHCFAMQPVFQRIEETYKDKAQFVFNPVGLLGGMMGPESQRAFAAASLMNIEHEFMAELFHEMHVNNKIPHSHADMVEFFGTKLGIPENRLEKEYSAFPAAGLVAGYDAAVDKYQIDAVPEILVNGKYLAVMESVNSEDELVDLIGYLLTLD